MLLFMTSLLTSCLDPLSLQLLYRHYIGEHCVKRLSNEDKSSRRTNVLDVVTSPLTTITSQNHVTSSAMSPIECLWPFSYRLPIGNNPLSPAVSEILSLKY